MPCRGEQGLAPCLSSSSDTTGGLSFQSSDWPPRSVEASDFPSGERALTGFRLDDAQFFDQLASRHVPQTYAAIFGAGGQALATWVKCDLSRLYHYVQSEWLLRHYLHSRCRFVFHKWRPGVHLKVEMAMSRMRPINSGCFHEVWQRSPVRASSTTNSSCGELAATTSQLRCGQYARPCALLSQTRMDKTKLVPVWHCILGNNSPSHHSAV